MNPINAAWSILKHGGCPICGSTLHDFAPTIEDWEDWGIDPQSEYGIQGLHYMMNERELNE